MIVLKQFLYSLNYILTLIDDFSKPSTLLFTVINYNYYQLYYYFFLFSSLITNMDFIGVFIKNTTYLKYYVLRKLKYDLFFETEDLFVFINPIFYDNFKHNLFTKIIIINLNIITSKYGIFFWEILINFIYFTVFSLIFFNFFVKIQKKLNHSFFLIQKFTKEQDQEISSFEDILLLGVFFIAFFINIFNLYSIQDLININYSMSVLFTFFFFFTLVIMVPVSILFSAGSNVLLYLKGVEKLNSLIGYIIADFIAILAFFLRFFLQIIRWCLFLTTYYLLHEFVFEWMYDLFINIFNNNLIQNNIFNKMYNNIFIQILLHFARFCFELFDTCLILLIQITAFIAVILWLFNYLFSLSMEDIYENK